MKKTVGKRIGTLILSLIVSITIFAGAGFTSLAYTETTGTVSSDNVKVRESASTTATQVSSLSKGDTIDIVDEATDASGYVWYKIRVNKSEYGYVRSDLVSKAGGSSSSSTTTTTTKNTTESNASAASLPATTVTATDQKSATAVDNCNVREGAGTAYDSVGKLSKGDSVTITGEATGTDSKTWYQITFGSSNKTGFVRGDLLNIVETAPAETETTETTEGTETTETTEGENAETTEGAVTEGEVAETEETTEETTTTDTVGDGAYALTYENETWYLYDYGQGQRVQVEQLIDVAEQVPSLNKKANSYKTVIIILAVIIALLLIGVVILALKLRESLYYEDDEDEEYDRYSERPRRTSRGDEDDEEEEVRPRRRARDDEEEEPVRRASRRQAEDRSENVVRPSRNAESRPSRNPEDRPARASRRSVEDSEPDTRASRRNTEDADSEARTSRRPSRRPAESYEDERASRRASRVQEEAETPKRRAKNFIGDDDDFEFEFLDLDDDK